MDIWYDGLQLTAAPYTAELVGKDDVAPSDIVLVPVSGGAPVHGKTQPKELILNLNVGIKRPYGSGDFYTYRHQLAATFDTRDATARKLKILSQGVERYVMARPRSFIRGNGPTFAIQLVVEDARWLSETEHTDSEAVTTSGQMWVVANVGNVAALPEIRITPTSYRTAGYQYRRWVRVYNQTDRAFENYPLEVTSNAGTGINTTTWVSGGKMQADGDDLRVIVDGVEVDRWFGAASGQPGGPNSTTTKVWINVDLSPARQVTLATAIAGTGAVTTISVTGDLTDWPVKGMVLIDSEVFTYTGKNGTRQLTGVSRAARGTSMAVHSVGATIRWIEHDIWLIYGDSTVSAPEVDDEAKPLIELATSTNSSWVYAVFESRYKTGSAEWTFAGQDGVTWPAPIYGGYVGNHGSTSYDANNRATEMGLEYSGIVGESWWWIYHPAGISTVSMDGEKYVAGDVDYWDGDLLLESSMDGLNWFEEWSEGAPSSADAWESWTHNGETMMDVTYYVRLRKEFNAAMVAYAEAGNATLVLRSEGRPSVNLGSETHVYPLGATITNVTTGEAFEFNDLVCDLSETVVVDVSERTVENVTDQANCYAYFEARQDGDWLTLAPGNNTLKYEESGVQGVTVQVKWRDTWN